MSMIYRCDCGKEYQDVFDLIVCKRQHEIDDQPEPKDPSPYDGDMGEEDGE